MSAAGPLSNFDEASSVDVLLSTYNGARYLPDLLRSLRRQTHQNWRLIVRDDGSDDGSRDLIRRAQQADPRVRILDTREHLGPARSFLRLLEEVDAPAFAFCDQDDIWLPQKLSWGLAALRSPRDTRDEIEAVGFDAVVVDSRRRLLHSSALRQRRLPRSPWFGDLIALNAAIGATLVGTRGLARAITQIGAGADVPMHDWWSAAVASYTGSFRIEPAPVIEWRRHPRTATGATPPTAAGRASRRRAYLRHSIEMARALTRSPLPPASAAIDRAARTLAGLDPERQSANDLLRLALAGVGPWPRGRQVLLWSSVLRRDAAWSRPAASA